MHHMRRNLIKWAVHGRTVRESYLSSGIVQLNYHNELPVGFYDEQYINPCVMYQKPEYIYTC